MSQFRLEMLEGIGPGLRICGFYKEVVFLELGLTVVVLYMNTCIYHHLPVPQNREPTVAPSSSRM